MINEIYYETAKKLKQWWYFCTCCLVGWLFSENHFWRRGISVSGSKHILILGLVTWRWSAFRPRDAKLENALPLTEVELWIPLFDAPWKGPRFLQILRLLEERLLLLNPFKSMLETALACPLKVSFDWSSDCTWKKNGKNCCSWPRITPYRSLNAL